MDWNNNYGADEDRCVLFHCGNWAKSFLPGAKVSTAAGRRALQSFDASLREPGNALNPGTTADVVTATLFVALLEGIL